jgi:hypothetical protein
VEIVGRLILMKGLKYKNTIRVFIKNMGSVVYYALAINVKV